MLTSLNIEKYLFIPFKDHGRDFTGCDCRGLVGLIIKEIYGIDIPDAKVSCVEKSKVNSVINELNDWVEVKEPTIEKPCILLFCTEEQKQIDHMGLYIGNGKFIHTGSKMKTPKTNSIYHSYWQYLLEGYYVPSS